MDIEMQDKIDLLIQENEKLKNNISSLQALLGSDICKFFEKCQSIGQTRKRFCYETISECYHDLVYFYGSSDPLEDADDFKKCRKKVFGKDNSHDETDNDDYKEDMDTYIDNSDIE